MKEQVNDNQVRDYDVVLDAEEQAYAFYSGQIIRDVRKGE